LQDELYIKYRLNELIPPDTLTDDKSSKIDNPVIRKEVLRVQRICEGQNLEIKKTLNKYSSLIEKQRKILFDRRDNILVNHSFSDFFKMKTPEKFNQFLFLIGKKKLNYLCQIISLYFIDSCWQQYLAEISDIRESIHLKRVGGQDPYIEFQKLAIKIYDQVLHKLDDQLIQLFNTIQFNGSSNNLEQMGIKAPSATWTYLINDDPFENIIGMQLIGDTSKQIGAVMMTPFLALRLLFKNKRAR